MLSVVIPTKDREGSLHHNLRLLRNQSLSQDNFEVVIVNDGGPINPPAQPYQVRVIESEKKGPAAARNLGAEHASGSAVLFIGDDCLPHPHLLYYHWLHYHRGYVGAIQGYTDWWKNLPPLAFEEFLYESGLQASWSNLKNQNGSWKSDATGFCLTTNYSISKSEFDRLRGFRKEFPNAAWEDVELGFIGQKHGLKTIFEPRAVNHHAHRQTLDGYVKRQMTEGKSRLHLCAIHPELSSGLLDPQGLRDSQGLLPKALEAARETHFDIGDDIKAQRFQRWMTALRFASLEGIRQGLNERLKDCRAWEAVFHIHTPEQSLHVVATASSLERGELGYAATSAEWALNTSQGNWALWCLRGEVHLALGQKIEAIRCFTRGIELGPGEKWPMERIDKLK